MKKVYIIACMLLISSILIVPATSKNTVESMPAFKVTDIFGGFVLSVSIKNIGEVDANDVNWGIRFDGGKIFPRNQHGVIDSIAAGDEETLKIRIFGFGNTLINISSECGEGTLMEMNATGSVFIVMITGRLGYEAPFLILSRNFEGVTPGYWKNHYEDPKNAWNATGYYPNGCVGDVFYNSWRYDLDNDSLLAALSYKGGNDTTASARMLLRAAVAALLNAAHPLVNYPYTVAQVIFRTDSALKAGDREGMLDWKDTFDSYNNLGCEDKLY